MTLPNYYPKANRKQWQPNLAGGATFTRVEKLLLHTTETQGWPGYPGFAPQLTYNPWTHEWRQHMPLTRSATTLEDPSWTNVRENRDNIIQVEIVAYCDPNYARKYGHDIHKIDEQAKKDLGEFAKWLHDNAGLNLESTVKWVDYPQSYGRNASQRLSGPEFNAYKGILGHEHASGNVHGDPGKIDIEAILKYAKVGTQKSKATKKAWSGYLWTLKNAEAYDGTRKRRPDLDIKAGTKVHGTVDTHFANDGRYFRKGKKPHRVWYALDNGDWSHKKNGKPIG